MKIFCVMLCRDEIDILPQWMEHHLSMFSKIIVTDNGSVDGTRERLNRYPIQVIDEPGRDYRQSDWTHRMIEEAKAQGAEWICPLDADEFVEGDLKKVLSQTSGNIVKVKLRLFAPVIDKEFDQEVPGGDSAKWWKAFFRASDYQRIEMGNHDAKITNRQEEYMPLDQLALRHYPHRSFAQVAMKYIRGGEAYARGVMPPTVGAHWRKAYEDFQREGVDALAKIWREICEQ